MNAYVRNGVGQLSHQMLNLGMADYIDEKKANLKLERDEDLLFKSIENPEVFEYIVDRYQDAFLRKAKYILKSKEDAEDVVQEVFTKIYINASRFKEQEGATFKSWGYKILVNTSLTRYQRLKKLNRRTADLDPEFYELLPDKKSRQFENHEIYDYVLSTFSKIPDNLSRVLNMYFLEGHSQKEIANKEGVSIGAIKTRVHRAKQAFREASKD